MAKAKVGKKATGIAMELPECPVCFETMCAPIFQCQSGHSLCNSCTKNLIPPICPMCRQAMTQMRNLTLEDIISKANVSCPNKAFGCVYTMLTQDVDDHLKECIFRVMTCPLGAAFGKCSWTGNLKEMMDHFKERHPQHCNINMETGVELNNVSINEDERYMFLVNQGNLHFIVTMKIDTLQKVAYWVVQLIGCKKVAYQHIYEIHITSKQDPRRQVIFIDHCFNDTLSADAVFRLGKCGILPLDMFSHFILNKKFSFKFVIKKGTPKPKKFDKSNNSNENKQPNANKFNKPKTGNVQHQKSPGPAKNQNAGSKK